MDESYKYKSSTYATNIQYITTPLIILIFLTQFYLYISNGFTLNEESLFFLPFWFWASIFVTVNIFKLKYIEVNQNNILMKSLSGRETLEYKDIEWINQNIFGSNWFIISIKYKDNKTGKSKIIRVFPEMYTKKERLSVFRELNITQYIREQVIKVKPEYKIENEPSRWSLFVWMMLSLIPFLLISFILIM